MSGFICPRCGEHTDIFGSGGGETMAREMGVAFLGRIPIEPQVVTASDGGTPVVESHPHSETAKSFGRVVRRLLEPELEQAAVEADDGNQEGDMKIAIPIAQGNLCLHFGHCEQFALFAVDAGQKKILGKEMLDPPQHEPGVFPRWLSEKGADVILTGGMGARAQSLFNQAGVKVVTGVPAMDPEKVVLDYLNGTLQAGANVCDH
ncbi:MAG: hypothetical protein DRI34_09300 [Deltaproteobacteria bacterium]|nr:MAG: hypothetical protein DRI34_09300 [Deltaproteobacteria bacterium]